MSKKKIDTSNSLFSYTKEKEQRTDWLILILSAIAGYVLFKICYPYPVTISDSGTYVQAAMSDTFNFYRPFGYSYFLQIVHKLSSSIHAIFVVQMLIYMLAVSMFAFTLKYTIPPISKKLWYPILFLLIFNPIAMFMANAIMSDLIFAAFIYIALAAFIYMLSKKSWIAYSILLISLFLLLHIRYSAMLFPIIFVVLSLIMMKGAMRWSVLAGAAAIMLVFYSQVKTDMKETTGLNQFSTGFDGWQMASNGLHILPFIELDAKDISDPDIQVIHHFMSQYKEPILAETKNGTEVSARFMWNNNLPLKQFLYYYIQQTNRSYPTSWVQLGSEPYKQYGQYLITHYPLQFAKYYYLPNAREAFYPTIMEILEYPETAGTKHDIANWYNIKEETDTSAKFAIHKSWLNPVIQIGTLAIWLIILASVVAAVVMRKKIKLTPLAKKTLACITLFAIIYYAASIFASPIQVRFWTAMGVLQFSFIYILVNQLIASKKEIN